MLQRRALGPLPPPEIGRGDGGNEKGEMEGHRESLTVSSPQPCGPAPWAPWQGRKEGGCVLPTTQLLSLGPPSSLFASDNSQQSDVGQPSAGRHIPGPILSLLLCHLSGLGQNSSLSHRACPLICKWTVLAPLSAQAR